MKLLSPSELKDKRTQEQVRDVLRTQELYEASEKARKRLANAEADFQNALAGQRERYAREEQAHSNRVSDMQKEIAVLERKKLNLLIPQEVFEASGERKMLEANKFLTELQRREARAEQLLELLEDKLDKVGQKDQDIRRREQMADIKEQTLKQQLDIYLANVKVFNTKASEWVTERARQETELQQGRNALALEQRSIQAQKEINDNTQKNLSGWAQRLQDERATLDRAWQVFKNMGGNIPIEKKAG